MSYVAAAALAWAFSPRGLASFAHLVGMASLGASALLVADLGRDDGRRRALVRAAAAGALLAAGAALVGGVLFVAGIATPFLGSYGDLVPGPYPRLQGPCPHPNLLASVCLFGSAMAAASGARPRARRAAQVVLAAALLFTFSRTLVTFALFTFLRTRRRTRGAAAAALLAAAAVVVLPTLVNVRIDPTRPWAAAVVDAPSPRATAALSAFRAFARDPLTGLGPGRPPGRVGGVPYDAHMTVVNVAATLGLPGLAALIFAVFALSRAGTPETGDPWWALLGALLVDSLATDVEDFRHLWIAMGLVASRARHVTPAA